MVVVSTRGIGGVDILNIGKPLDEETPILL
jgi:hypothetical protein